MTSHEHQGAAASTLAHNELTPPGAATRPAAGCRDLRWSSGGPRSVRPGVGGRRRPAAQRGRVQCVRPAERPGVVGKAYSALLRADVRPRRRTDSYFDLKNSKQLPL